MTVRSVAFYQNMIPVTATSTLFTVPTGKTLIVKEILLHNQHGAPADVRIGLTAVKTGTLFLIVYMTLTVDQIQVTPAYRVLNQNDVVWAASSTGGIAAWMSGSLLYGVADTTGASALPSALE